MTQSRDNSDNFPREIDRRMRSEERRVGKEC